jgi:hypothetical protein
MNTPALQDLAAILPALIAQELAKQHAAAKAAQTPPDPRDSITVSSVVSLYFENRPDEVTPAVLTDRRNICDDFAAVHGTKPVSQCRPLDLSGWLREHPTWKSANTQKRVIGHLRRVFSWAVAMRLIREWPFSRVKLGASTPRRPSTDAEIRTLLR